ncbi:MAG: FAD-dependent oxidoreductase [bacterium]
MAHEVATRSVDRALEADVLVIGSGVSGYCAAIQAGRLGCRTILVEKDEVLGGNSGPNLGVGITGADRYNHYATETGIVHELQEEAAWIQAFTPIGAGTMPYNISRRYEAVVQEHLERAGVKVLKRHYAREPILDEDGSIIGVIAEDLASFQTVRIDVKGVVIEASGDGEIGARAGADFDVGCEAQSEFGERSAPERRNRLVQGTSLVAIAYRTDHEVVFIPPAGTPPFQPRVWHGRISSFVRHHEGWFGEGAELKFLYVTETGGHLDTIRDDGEIYEILLRQLWAEWDHIKNGPHREEARNWDLLWVSPKAGKRESRRFLGDIVLTQTDVEEGRRFPDDVAYGGHDLDDHRPLGEGSNIFAHSVPPLYGIPFRCCYSRNVPNLLLAGRLISATHLAHSSARVMRTGGAIGQAVGFAAALCCRYNCTPRGVFESHLDELVQGLLEADATILAKPLDGGRDLAREATVTATSEMRFNDQEPGQFVPLIAPAGVILWDWAPSLEAVELFLRNDSGEDQPLTLRVCRTRRDPKWKSMDDYERYGRCDLRDEVFSEISAIRESLPPDHRGWFKVSFPEPLNVGEKDCTSDDDRLLIALGENKHIQWALARREIEIAEMVEHSHHRPEWRSLEVMATLRLMPPPRLGEAANVVNGFHRRFSRGPTNMWISDPDMGLPQDLILEWPEPQEFDEVCITFDNLARLRSENPWECGARVSPILVRAYELACWREGEWYELVHEDGNHHRFRRHSFDPVRASKLRLRVLSINGGRGGARVYQVRVARKG